MVLITVAEREPGAGSNSSDESSNSNKDSSTPGKHFLKSFVSTTILRSSWDCTQAVELFDARDGCTRRAASSSAPLWASRTSPRTRRTRRPYGQLRWRVPWWYQRGTLADSMRLQCVAIGLADTNKARALVSLGHTGGLLTGSDGKICTAAHQIRW